MFDRHFHQCGPRSVDITSKTTVTEQRAPTDQSVALLREMERKAEETLLHSIRLNLGTELEVRAIVRQGIFMDELRFQFRMNSTLHDVTLEVRRGAGKEAYILAVRDELARKLATEILILQPDFLK